MQTLIAEQPLITCLILGILALGVGYGWLQTGKRELAAGALVLIALIPAAWLLADYWVTEREEIEQLIYATASAIESNDHERAVALIADVGTRDLAQRELANYVFDVARVAKIRDINVIEGAFPPEADVDLNVKIVVSQRSGGMQNVSVPRRLMFAIGKVGESVVDHRLPAYADHRQT